MLVINKDNEQTLFREELAKFQTYVDKIKQNVDSTSTLLRELKACHAKIVKDKGDFKIFFF